ncbi:hypothetical protein IU501_30905 [Nocardia otitidiscaviarum]|uniref:hypothetical protein n=1 Tax=Nocardia otitidiscaviarum TaxID=1823 RepID=UPI0004A72A27|nr:hypothetical protein [Nocardia otitidiscaviarum]MBF6137387.1 hypothetical protein [Nocardia otitidiscaviarum]MBF6488351.1 hypothetical protein [Nocardia otitidiscaviarum]
MAFTQNIRETALEQAALVLLSGFVAIWAVAGAVGLAGGGIDLGQTIVRRFPFESPVFAALALALVVAVPMAVTSWSAAHGERRAPTVAIASGGLLIGWIVVQIAVIRTFSILQPVCVLFGIAIVILGLTWRPNPEGDR